jgi:hypothetical protein
LVADESCQGQNLQDWCDGIENNARDALPALLRASGLPNNARKRKPVKTAENGIGHMSESSINRSRWPVALSVLLVGIVVVIAIASAMTPALLPFNDQIGFNGRRVAAGVIFVGSYLALAIGRIPGLSIDRAGIALVGAGLMVASGALPLEDAYKAVHLDTITLLLGMMIIVASLRLSGFFAVANTWIGAHARDPFGPTWRRRRGLRCFFRLSGERCDLPGVSSTRFGVDTRVGASTVALPAGCRLVFFLAKTLRVILSLPAVW